MNGIHASKQKKIQRKFFLAAMDISRSDAAGVLLANEEKIGGPGVLMIRDCEQRGFHKLAAKPHFILDRKLGLRVRDVEFYGPVWLVSGRAKSCFEAADKQAFDFCACDIENRNEPKDTDYWLCDVVRIIDAIDASGPNIKKEYDGVGRLFYPLAFSHKITIKEDVESNYHVFRPQHMEMDVFVDNEVISLCRKNKISGLKFYDLLKL